MIRWPPKSESMFDIVKFNNCSDLVKIKQRKNSSNHCIPIQSVVSIEYLSGTKSLILIEECILIQ